MPWLVYFLHATVRLTLSRSLFGLSLSRMSACVSAGWFSVCLKIESVKSAIIQNFSFLLSFLRASCQLLLQPRVSQAPGDLPYGRSIMISALRHQKAEARFFKYAG